MLHNSAALTFAVMFSVAPSAEPSIFTPSTVAELCLASICVFALTLTLRQIAGSAVTICDVLGIVWSAARAER